MTLCAVRNPSCVVDDNGDDGERCMQTAANLGWPVRTSKSGKRELLAYKFFFFHFSSSSFSSTTTAMATFTLEMGLGIHVSFTFLCDGLSFFNDV